jgi:hypothetical protein
LVAAVLFASFVSAACIQPAAAGNPLHPVISNVRDTSFVVSWLTDEAESGQVQLADGMRYDDDRGPEYRGMTHYVTVSGLEASQTYAFDLLSGGQLYDHAGIPWSVTTGAALPSFPPDLVSGKIKNRDGSAATEAIVFFAIDRQSTIPGVSVSAPLSTLVTSGDGGVFHVNLREARMVSNPSQYYSYGVEGDFRTTLMISAMGAQGTGMAAPDAGDRRLRTDDPAQWLVIELSADGETQ